MSMTIEQFNVWAGRNRNTAASLSANGENLESASNKIGFFARFFRREAVNRMRGDVMKDFTRALGNRYGVTIAQQAISNAKLSTTSELTGNMIIRVAGDADKLFEKAVKPDRCRDLRLSDFTIEKENFGQLGMDCKKFLGNFVRLRARVFDLLGEMPLTKPDYDEFCDRAANLTSELNGQARGTIPEGVPEEKFRAEVKALFEAITRRINEMKILTDGAPDGESNIQEYREIICDVVLASLDDASKSKDNSKAQKDSIAKVATAFKDPKNLQAFVQNMTFSKSILKDIAPRVIEMLKKQFEKDKITAVVSESDLIESMQKNYRKVLNRREWSVISKQLSVNMGKDIVSMTSTITPAAQLGRSEQSQRGLIGSRYPKGVNGYMSHSADAKHAVNLAVSQMSVADANGQSKLAFCGVRHSVHCAWEIQNPQERADANAARAEEAVMAAFMAKYASPGSSAELPSADENDVVNVDLNITSVALLTPDTMRHKFKRGSDKDERSMLNEQTLAWKKVMKKGVTFQFNGQKICVKPNILTFNFGVNEGAVNFSSVAPNKAGGWDLSDSMNKVAIESLEKEVGAFLKSHKNDDKTATAMTALKLLIHCKNVLALKTNRIDGHDAYKIAARIAVISQLIGNVPCWNCKSGKDRTGEMDVECKFLSVLIARGENIPKPGEKLTKEQMGLFRAIALQGGNFEVQKMNVGIAGFKTGGVSSIVERLGGKVYRNFHRGASDHVFG